MGMGYGQPYPSAPGPLIARVTQGIGTSNQSTGSLKGLFQEAALPCGQTHREFPCNAPLLRTPCPSAVSAAVAFMMIVRLLIVLACCQYYIRGKRLASRA